MKDKANVKTVKTTTPTTIKLPKTSFKDFLKGVWVELRHKVKWPTRKELLQDSIVVIGFLVFWTAYIGIWDFGFAQLLRLILK